MSSTSDQNQEDIADIISSINSIPNEQWDTISSTLRTNGGVATIDFLPPQIVKLHARCFEVARRGLDIASAASTSPNASASEVAPEAIKTIGPNDDSAHATGYHSADGSNSMSRYNTHREGFVFSDGQLFDVALPDSDISDKNEQQHEFRNKMQQIFASMHNGIAINVLKAVARNLVLSEQMSEDWFQSELGPTDESSQWHVKRYVVPSLDELNSKSKSKSKSKSSSSSGSGESGTASKQKNAKDDQNDGQGDEEEGFEWLPVHTDPSLISVVLHDVPGKKDGGMGLQYQAPAPASVDNGDNVKNKDRKLKVWKEVSYHGHAVATVFIGSVLSYITGGLFPGAKHRVLYRPPTDNECSEQRVAATLFVRPRGDAMLAVPPSPLLTEGERPVRVRNRTFNAWVARVSRNYMKQKKSKRSEKETATTTKNGKAANGDNGAAFKDDNSFSVPSPPMTWSDEFTELSLHPSDPPLVGQEKYLGGEVSSKNGKIYAIPGHAKRVLEIDPTVEPPIIRQIGPEFKGEFKWLRGIEIGDVIYGIPCHADSIIKIIPLTGEVKTISWDTSLPGAPPVGLKWKWHGGEFSPLDNCFYAIPQAADYVMKLDPATDTVSFIGPAFEGRNLWYGGLVGNDGAVYGICQNATGVLRIDPVKQTAAIHGSYPQGGFKWHGGVRSPCGTIYGIPAHADTVLKVVPGQEPQITTIGGPLRSGDHRNDNKYKYLGGAVGIDGNVYFFPSDADYVLQVDPRTDGVREVGPNLRELEPLHHNKWQNGFANKSCLYGIPLKATTILRIKPKAIEEGGAEPDAEPEISCVGGQYVGINKWEGGIVSKSGDMYCMPLNYSMVLRMRSL